MKMLLVMVAFGCWRRLFGSEDRQALTSLLALR
jgi:hypothetical protein